MTIGEIIASAEKQRPGAELTFAEYLCAINRIEADIYENIISRHENAQDFYLHENEDENVFVPDIYAQLYVWYLLCEIDLLNGDITRYGNDKTLFNNIMAEFFDWYNRTHMPKTTAKLGGINNVFA